MFRCPLPLPVLRHPSRTSLRPRPQTPHPTSCAGAARVRGSTASEMGQNGLCLQPVPYELVEAIRQRAPALAAVEGVIPVKVVFHLTNPPQASTLPAKYRGLLDTSRTFMVGRLVLNTQWQGGGQRYYLACNKKAVEERMPFLAEGPSRVMGWNWRACVTGKSLHYNLDFQQVDGRAVVLRLALVLIEKLIEL